LIGGGLVLSNWSKLISLLAQRNVDLTEGVVAVSKALEKLNELKRKKIRMPQMAGIIIKRTGVNNPSLSNSLAVKML